MSTNKGPDHWSEVDRDARRPRIEPWAFFGIALIVAVASAAFALVTWVYRSDEASRAVERAESLRDRLSGAEERVQELEEQTSRNLGLITEKKDQIESLERENRTLEGELAAARREVEGTKDALKTQRSADLNPGGLQTASVADVLNAPDAYSLSIELRQDSPILTQGAMLLHANQELRHRGFAMNDSAADHIILSLAVVSTDRTVAVSASLEVRQRWKVPGEDRSRPVIVWSSHRALLSGRERAAELTEQLTTVLISELASASRRGG